MNRETETYIRVDATHSFFKGQEWVEGKVFSSKEVIYICTDGSNMKQVLFQDSFVTP